MMDGAWTTALLLAAGTLASEDLTCITAGLLIARKEMDPLAGILGCLIGIYVGDLGLWGIGRLVRRGIIERAWIASRLPAGRLSTLDAWLEAKGWRVIVAARFLPGTRVTLYIASGMLGRRAGSFALWSLLAACVWTPLVVGCIAVWGVNAAQPFELLLGHGGAALAVTAGGIWLLSRWIRAICSPSRRSRLRVRLQRWRRYEFWPSWVFYAPMAPYLLYLAIRYRGLTTLTAVNPGIPHSGVVGESKFAILSNLPKDSIVPSAWLSAGDLEARCGQLNAIVHERGWTFPLVLKPDAGQRGAGVKKVSDWPACRSYLAAHPGPVLVQVYHAGPHEAGVFYYRIPGRDRGHIFSITEKVFPIVVGDGRRTLGGLIDAHPRYRLQSAVFRARHAHRLNQVLASGEPFALALAGNHCQGTLFRDGVHLLTPELERAIDSVARQFHGFHLGRFDVRFENTEQFKAGKGWSIIELNGVTSESTNLYDPSWSLLRAYRTLARQWRLAFQIGHLNRQRGHATTALGQLLSEIRTFYATRQPVLLSD